jgi:dethiobiotin synthetase
MNGFFVTGTDTGVGKTVLSALLVAALDGIYWKPVQTGAIEGTDLDSVRLWAECPAERLLPERYRFESPVSPHLAGRKAGIQIALDDFGLLAPVANHPHIVEGAGGAMVPLNEHDLMLDLIRHFGLPVVGANNVENRSAIEHFGNVRVIGHIPVLERIHRAALLEVFDKNFDRLAFK